MSQIDRFGYAWLARGLLGYAVSVSPRWCKISRAHRTSSGNDGVCLSPCGGFQCRKLACFLCGLDFLSVGFVLEDVLFCVDTMGEV